MINKKIIFLLFLMFYALPAVAATPVYKWGQECFEPGTFSDDCVSGLTCQESTLPSKTQSGKFRYFCSCKAASTCTNLFNDGPGAGHKWVCNSDSTKKELLGLKICGIIANDDSGSTYPAHIPVSPPQDFNIKTGEYYGRCNCDPDGGGTNKPVTRTTKNNNTVSCTGVSCKMVVGFENFGLKPKNQSDCDAYKNNKGFYSCDYEPIQDVKQDATQGLTCNQGNTYNSISCSGNTYTKGENKCKVSADCCQGGDSFCFLDSCYYTGITGGSFPTCPEVAPPPPAEAEVILDVKPPKLEINIPQLKFSDVTSTLDDLGYLHIPYIGEYISAIYKISMVLVSIIGVVMIIIVGVKITVLGGEERVAGFKRIGQIVVGLSIAWGSYAILYNINPDLVNFQALKVQYIVKEDLVYPDDFSDPAYSSASGSTIDIPSEFPNFKQINYKTPFGYPDACPKDTIANSGCGPTSLSMVVRNFGYDVDPPKIALEWMGTKHLKKGSNSCGAVGSGGMFQDKAFLEKYKLNSENIGPNKDKIFNALKNGKPVIVSMRPISSSQPSRWTKGGHFIVLVKINPDGTIFVRDPGRRALCVRDINKCPGEPTVSLTSVNPDLLFPFIKAATAFSKK